LKIKNNLSNIKNPFVYNQLITVKDEDFTSKVVSSEIEVCKLIEAGFEYVCDYNNNKVFRKRK